MELRFNPIEAFFQLIGFLIVVAAINYHSYALGFLGVLLATFRINY